MHDWYYVVVEENGVILIEDVDEEWMVVKFFRHVCLRHTTCNLFQL